MVRDSVYIAPWYNTEWFSSSTLQSFTWAQQMYLYLLMVVPLIYLFRWLWRYRYNQKLPIAFTKKQVKGSALGLLRLIPEFVFMLVLALVLIALARPQRSNEKVEQWTEGIDIMLAIDISQSMMIEDFKPNRMDAAKAVALDFINGRFQDRIGIVVFSGDAFSLSPLTTDYDLLRNYIKEINFDMIEARGTAIGSALGVVTNRMRESTSASKVCILLSDGDNTAGNIDPITAAELASAYDIKIYSILIGKDGLVPFGKDFFGRPRMVENTVDEASLRKIAEIGNGEFYRVADQQALQNVFDRIDEYEKAEIKETRFKDTSDYYTVYLYWAISLLLLWLLLKSSFMSNVLQD